MVDARLAAAMWIFGSLVFLAYILFLYLERRSLVINRQVVHVFRPIWTVRLFYTWSMFFAAGIIAGPSLYLHRLEPWTISAGVLTIAIATATWPPSLYVGWNSVKSSRWWGGATEIRWDEVEDITYDYHGFRTIVTSATGARIEHTLIDCDPFGFQAEIVIRSDHRLAQL